MNDFAAFQTTEPPVQEQERPKRGPKKGVKRGPRAATNGTTAAPANSSDHDVLVAVVNLGKFLAGYPPAARQQILKALHGMFSEGA